MKDGVDLDDALFRPREEHPPVADPEPKARLRLYALDVAGAGFRVILDGGNDARAHSRVDPPQVAARPR